MRTSLNLLALADAIEKRAGLEELQQKAINFAAKNPEQAAKILSTVTGGGLGALAGGGIGALIPSRDEEGKTHRKRNALLGALLGGAGGAGLGYAGTHKIADKLMGPGVLQALQNMANVSYDLTPEEEAEIKKRMNA